MNLDELCMLLHCGNPHPSPGPDRWEKWCVKALSDQALTAILHLINFEIINSTIPDFLNHVTLLPIICPYLNDEVSECPWPPHPGPVNINDQEEYEVEKILDSKFRWGKLWYLVKFLDWSNSDNMWLSHSDIHTPANTQVPHILPPLLPQPPCADFDIKEKLCHSE